MNDSPSTLKRDALIPWYFVAAFLIVFVVNGIFVYLAIQSHSGMVSDHPYEKGRDYNLALDQDAKQQALGWRGDIQLNNGAVIYTLFDKNGAPISDAKSTAYFTYPVRQGYDFQRPLSANPLTGHYSAPIDWPIAGQWHITVQSIWKQQTHQTHQHLIIP